LRSAHRDLNRHRAFDGINDRHELSQQTIAHGLADTIAVLRSQRVDDKVRRRPSKSMPGRFGVSLPILIFAGS
jgi:hypothetical protein